MTHYTYTTPTYSYVRTTQPVISRSSVYYTQPVTQTGTTYTYTSYPEVRRTNSYRRISNYQPVTGRVVNVSEKRPVTQRASNYGYSYQVNDFNKVNNYETKVETENQTFPEQTELNWTGLNNSKLVDQNYVESKIRRSQSVRRQSGYQPSYHGATPIDRLPQEDQRRVSTYLDTQPKLVQSTLFTYDGQPTQTYTYKTESYNAPIRQSRTFTDVKFTPLERTVTTYETTEYPRRISARRSIVSKTYNADDLFSNKPRKFETLHFDSTKEPNVIRY